MNLLTFIPRAVLLLVAGAVAAQTPGSDRPRRSLPNYHILAGRPQKDSSALSERIARAQASALVRPGRGVLLDEHLGLPRFLWASADEGNRCPAKVRPQFASAGRRREEAVAREHLDRFASLYGLSSGDVAAAPLASIHDTGEGAVVVKLRQEVGGVEVFRDEVNIVMNRNLDLVAISGHIPPAAGGPPAFALRPPEALALAWKDLTGAPVDASAFEPAGAQGPYESFQLAPVFAEGVRFRMQTPARVKPVQFHLPEGLQAAYYLELDIRHPDAAEVSAYGYVFSATDGTLLFRKDLTAHDAFTYRVWVNAQKVPLPGPHNPAHYLPSITGLPEGLFPVFTLPELTTLTNGPLSTNDPWLPPGATETHGNNVDAYVDLDGRDGLTGSDFRAPVSASGVFGFTYDTGRGPDADPAQRHASITQLFYLTNFFHDWFYDAGFNEVSGNAQTLNHGRGGLEGDNLHAEAQDAGGMNNADMLTPADGGHPRMQMFLWTGPTQRSLALSPGAAPSTGGSAFGPQTYQVTGAVVLADDGTAPATDGCAPIAGTVAGGIALIDRGTCPYVVKVLHAQNAGALGVIVVDNLPGEPTDLGGTDPAITIPAVMISQAEGATLKGLLAAGSVSATMAQAASPSLDGSLDGQIVAHEWGHYLSNRLVGDSSGLTSNQAGALGEGWSDFLALLLSVQDGNVNLDGTFSVGGYVMRGNIPDGNSYYFGLRRFPYSVDMTKNPLTLKHISNGVALPAGIPVSPKSAENAEVHNAGEVWATMLWEAYVALLKSTRVGAPELALSEAQGRMKRYLVAALKATPVDPTFIEARDALLTAAAGENPRDAQLFFEAFARRGAGLGAQPPTDRFGTTNAGVVESFTVGGALGFQGATLAEASLQDGVVSTGETGVLSVTLKNLGGLDLGHTTATITNPDVVFPGGNRLTFPVSTPFTTVTNALPFVLQGGADLATTVFTVSFTDPDLVVAGPLMATVAFRVNRLDPP